VLGTASLVACSESSGPTGPDNTITVQGRVVAEYLQPLPSTYVLIAGHETVTTDANGYFSVTKVSAPSDLIRQIPNARTRDLLTSYTGYGATPLRLHKGDYHEGPAVTMSAPVVAGSIAGTINVPTGLSTTRKSLLLRFRSSVPARWVIVTDSTPTNSFTYVTP